MPRKNKSQQLFLCVCYFHHELLYFLCQHLDRGLSGGVERVAHLLDGEVLHVGLGLTPLDTTFS